MSGPRAPGERWPGAGRGAQVRERRLSDLGQGRRRPARGRSRFPQPCCRGSLSSRLRYKTPASMTAAPPARRHLSSCAGCGCCWRSWSSPPPGPGPAQVSAGFGPRSPRWPLGAPAPRPSPRLRPWAIGAARRAEAGRPGGAGAGERGPVCAGRRRGAGPDGPRPGGVRVWGKDASPSRLHACLRLSLFLARPAFLVPRGPSSVAVHPVAAQC